MTVAPTPVRGFVLRPLHVVLFTVLLLFVLAFAALLLGRDESSTGVVEGSGVPVTQVRTVPPFTGVELAGESQVSVRAGQEQTVAVHADDNLVEQITTHVVGGVLVVATPGSFKAASPMAVEVTVPELDAVTLSGTGAVTVEAVDHPKFRAELLGDGMLSVAGNVDRLEAILGGTGDAQLQDLVAREVVAKVSGTGRLSVHATHSLNASVPGTGEIFYTGHPSNVKQSVTGTGAIVER